MFGYYGRGNSKVGTQAKNLFTNSGKTLGGAEVSAEVEKNKAEIQEIIEGTSEGCRG